MLPGQEGHGGSTFCGVASLVLMNRLDQVIDQEWRKELIQWCVLWQIGGFQGRPNKLEDTCYSFWIGGTLRLLGEDGLLEHEKLRSFVMQCQSPMGGFCKVTKSYSWYWTLHFLTMVHYQPRICSMHCQVGTRYLCSPIPWIHSTRRCGRWNLFWNCTTIHQLLFETSQSQLFTFTIWLMGIRTTSRASWWTQMHDERSWSLWTITRHHDVGLCGYFGA